MNKKLIFSVLLVCLLAVVAVVAFAQNTPNVRWEYRVIVANPPTNENLNALGREGWELVTNSEDSVNYNLIFKRRLP